MGLATANVSSTGRIVSSSVSRPPGPATGSPDKRQRIRVCESRLDTHCSKQSAAQTHLGNTHRSRRSWNIPGRSDDDDGDHPRPPPSQQQPIKIGLPSLPVLLSNVDILFIFMVNLNSFLSINVVYVGNFVETLVISYFDYLN